MCDRRSREFTERERQVREREAELAEALGALETSRKAVEDAAALLQVRRVCFLVLTYRRPPDGSILRSCFSGLRAVVHRVGQNT